MKTILSGLAAALTVFILVSCAGQSRPPAVDASLIEQGFIQPSSDAVVIAADGTVHNHTFPRPPELEPQIDFWRHVYARWSNEQVALHDDRHMDLVYTVLQLPGPVTDGRYNAAQRRFVKEQREALKTRLEALESKVIAGESLSLREQHLMTRITASSGGRAAVFGAGERLRYQRGLRERFRRGLEISGRYDALFRDIFRRAGIPEDIAYLPHVESSFQAHARSSVGATGMWQFTKGAARLYMNNHPALDERLDPVASARGAARYLRDAYDKLGDWSLALTSYNHGIGGMRRAQEQFGNDFAEIVYGYRGPYFGFASRNFYAEFLAARDIASQPRHFFANTLVFEPPLDWDRIVLARPMPVTALALYYDINEQALHRMNPAWTSAARRGSIALPAGTEVWLPAGTLVRTVKIQGAARPSLAMTEEERSSQVE